MARTPLTDEEVLAKILENPTMVMGQFEDNYGVRRQRYKRIYAEHHVEIEKKKGTLENKSPIDGSKWVKAENYVYNDKEDTYVTFLRCVSKPVVISGDTHRAMQSAYSNWDGQPATVNQICRKFSFPRPWFNEYKQVHGWTHDKEPFTNEEVMSRPIGEMVSDVLEARRNVLAQEFEKSKWEDTKNDAEKWRNLQSGTVQPFNLAMEAWKPVVPKPIKLAKDTEPFSLIVTASDWQIGMKAIEANMVFGKSWNVQIGIDTLHKYMEQIKRDVDRLNVNWQGCYLFNLGDLPHGMRGMTEAGTFLVMDATKKQQYDAVYSLQTYFIESLHSIFGKIEEIGVAGNHEGFDWYAISRALQERYRDSADIKISAHTKMLVYKKIGCVLFILTHGKNPIGMKFKYPAKDNPARQELIRGEIIQILSRLGKEEPEMLADIEQIAFLQGDNHSIKFVEKTGYLDLQFGTAVHGDEYADSMRLHSRPSQGCLLLSHETGIKGILNYYLDDLKLQK